MSLNKRIYELSKQINQRAIRGINIFATAESCTGGMVASAITSVSGSSAYFDRGFVTYSNSSKKDMLGVLENSLDTDGAVSKLTSIEMALGAVHNSNANISLSITGIAGPSGGSKAKPVGTVFIAIALPKTYNAPQEISPNLQELVSYHSITDIDDKMKIYVAKFLFSGNRSVVRKKSCIAALELLLATIST